MKSEDVEILVSKFTEAVEAGDYDAAEREVMLLLEVIAANEPSRSAGPDSTEEVLAELRSEAPNPGSIGKFTAMANRFIGNAPEGENTP